MKRGAVLWEMLWPITILLVLLAGSQASLIRYWNRRLGELDEKKERYDGEKRFGTGFSDTGK